MVRHKKNEKMRTRSVRGEIDGSRTYSDLSQCNKAQLDRFTHYK